LQSNRHPSLPRILSSTFEQQATFLIAIELLVFTMSINSHTCFRQLLFLPIITGDRHRYAISASHGRYHVLQKQHPIVFDKAMTALLLNAAERYQRRNPHPTIKGQRSRPPGLFSDGHPLQFFMKHLQTHWWTTNFASTLIQVVSKLYSRGNIGSRCKRQLPSREPAARVIPIHILAQHA
jgi:hypothetical protein